MKYYSGTNASRHHRKGTLLLPGSAVFYILLGTATFVINGELFTVPAQNGVPILPDQQHQLLNQTQADLLFTVTSQLTSRGDRFEVK